jgi:sRNA-binding carbon storage regulator CsrA
LPAPGRKIGKETTIGNGMQLVAVDVRGSTVLFRFAALRNITIHRAGVWWKTGQSFAAEEVELISDCKQFVAAGV